MSDQLRVLVVEDNPADADFIQETLEETGLVSFRIESVSRLSQAFTRLESKGIDLVFLDLGLPDSQGLQTLHKFRQALPEVPVIVLTGTDDQELALTAVRDGAQDYLVKGQFNRSLLTRAARYAVERQKAETALRESETHYRALVEGIPGLVYSFSTKRGCLYYSSHVTELLGYSPEQLYSQPLLWNKSIHPDDLPRVEQVIREAAAGKQFHIEYRIRDALGNWRWFDDRSFECRIDGADAIIEGLALDITERKRIDAALRKQAEELIVRNDRLNRFNKAVVGRELRMIELKREVNELCAKLGEPPRHRIAEHEQTPSATPETQA